MLKPLFSFLFCAGVFLDVMKHAMLSLLLVLVVSMPALSQSIRPVRDDIGFCWDAGQMKRLLNFLEPAEKGAKPIPDIVAGIVPHDDYLYAARVGYPLFKNVRATEVVVFGVTHATVRAELGDPGEVLLLDDHRSWIGPYGSVIISPLRKFIAESMDSSLIRIDSKAHRIEHSIEALVPFLQHFNPEVKITPIMVTAMSVQRMDSLASRLAQVLAEYVAQNKLLAGRDIVFLISSDANHYGTDFKNSPLGLDERAHQMATENDKRIINASLTGPVTAAKLRRFSDAMESVKWCGRYSIPFGLLTVQKLVHQLTGRTLDGSLLRYSDTYTEGVIPLTKSGMGITAPFSLKHWVGFFSATYTIR